MFDEIFPDVGVSMLVLVGELRGETAMWNLHFDPSFSQTDGQIRALGMQLQRLIGSIGFQFNTTTNMGGQEVYISSRPMYDSEALFCVVLPEDKFNVDLIESINEVVKRGGVYTSKKFYLEVVEVYTKRKEDPITTEKIMEAPTPELALNFLRTTNFESLDLVQIANLLIIIGTDNSLFSQNEVFQMVSSTLARPMDEEVADIVLDSAFVIGNKYLEANNFSIASSLFQKIANLASNFNRLALEISCRIRSTRLHKLQGADNGMVILDELSPIDDGSLEVASQSDREEYYCLQGYAFSLMGDDETAEDLYMMAILIAESEAFPSMYKAEAHSFIGKRAGQYFNPDIATRELLTASSIAKRNGFEDIASVYSHLAGIQELHWSKMLASSSIISRLNGEVNNAEFYAWQSLKRLINAYVHSNPESRKNELQNFHSEIIAMIRSGIGSSVNEYSDHTIDEVKENLGKLDGLEFPKDAEIEILKYLTTKVSAMIPFPTPIIMLIANDGRLIIAGEVLADSWENAISDNDDLFSGALSAIMAIISEVMTGEAPLRMVDAGQTQIMIEKSKACIGALLVDRDLNLIRKALKQVVTTMELEYPELEQWDGYSIDLSNVKPMVDLFFKEALNLLQNS